MDNLEKAIEAFLIDMLGQKLSKEEIDDSAHKVTTIRKLAAAS